MRNKAPAPENIPPPSTNYDVKWANSLVLAITRAFAARPPATQPVTELLMFSPDGSVYAVKVSNTGELSTELRSRP